MKVKVKIFAEDGEELEAFTVYPGNGLRSAGLAASIYAHVVDQFDVDNDKPATHHASAPAAPHTAIIGGQEEMPDAPPSR